MSAALARSLSSALYHRRRLTLALLLGLPLFWLGVVYCGSLAALLANSFFGMDPFSGLVKREFTLQNFVDLAAPANLDVILRTVAQSIAHAQALAKKYTGDKAEASVDAFLGRRRAESGE